MRFFKSKEKPLPPIKIEPAPSKNVPAVIEKKSKTSFIRAINNNDLEQITKHFDIAYVNSSSNDYSRSYNALTEASLRNDNFKVVKFLLESGADPFIRKNNFVKVLIKNNSIETCKYFLENIEIDENNLMQILDIVKEHESNNTVKSLIHEYCISKLHSWKKDNQHTISNIEPSLNTGVTVKSIFNFSSARRTIVTSTVNSELIETADFAEIPDKQELEFACDKLIEQGGTPDKSKIYASNNTDKHNKTPFINQPKQRT